jgi:gliding motility-associated-like protein
MIDPSSTVICDGSFITLQASKNEGYQWFLDNKAIPSANGQSFNATLPGVYTMHSRNEHGCVYVSTKTVQLTKVFQPIANFTYGSTCANLPTLFNNTSDTSKSGLVDFLWFFGDSASSTLSSPAHTYKSQGSFTPRLTVTPRFCKQLSVTKSIQLTVQFPETPLRYTPVNAVSGKDLQLKARAFSGASYVWSPGKGISSITSPQPFFNNTSPQTYFIRIINAAGCVFTDTLDVRMFSSQEIFVPELFSPNNDGKNDKLNVFLVGITNLRMFKIFNRWGQLMYQLRNEADGWDGTYLGIGQPMGTYLWQAEGLDIDGKIIRRSGKTILIR